MNRVLKFIENTIIHMKSDVIRNCFMMIYFNNTVLKILHPISTYRDLRAKFINKWFVKFQKLSEGTQGYCNLSHLDFNYSCDSRIFNPCEVVTRVLNDYYELRIVRCMGISKIDVVTMEDGIHIFINLIRPGILIGKGGKDIDNIKARLEREFKCNVYIDIEETKFNFYYEF